MESVDTPLGQLPGEEYIMSGHNACPGCGATLAIRYMLKETGDNSVIVIPASCWSIISGVVPLRCLDTVVMHCPFPAAAGTGSGIKKGLEAVGDQDTQVIVLAGDGATFDIGIQGLSGAAERNEDIIYVCYDNEAYMNTGVQRSSATPYASFSTTTPVPKVKPNPKKDIMKIVADHKVPYAATSTIAYPADILSKFRKALSIKGFRFLHLLIPCPQGWGSPVEMTVELSRRAVLSRLFPLMEVENGEEYTLNYVPPDYFPLENYIKPQKRFSSVTSTHVEEMQQAVDKNWEELCVKAGIK